MRRGFEGLLDRLTDFFYFSGPDTASAYIQTHMCAMGPDSLDRLYIGLGHLLGFIV
jgi:hypothetical protein